MPSKKAPQRLARRSATPRAAPSRARKNSGTKSPSSPSQRARPEGQPMPTYLSPGVYVEELEAGARPIEGVGTAIAAFVGLASDGPFHTPTLVTNWSQFTTTFGEPLDGSYLAHAVYGYFLNGGGQAYVVRVGGPA